MTSTTETKTKVTEVINSINYNTGYQYSVTGTGVEMDGSSISPGTTSSSTTIDGVTSTWTNLDLNNRPNWKQTTPGAAFQFTETYQEAQDKQSNNHRKNNRIRKYHNNYKYLYAVIALLFASPVNAETVGGVSATASPVANSSGSVTNQAIQVLQGPYITNTYGGGISCQGPTLNITPYVTGAVSAQKPYEGYYDDPVYDMTDNFGAFDENGLPIGDGRLDNPGDVQFYRPVRTGQKTTII